MVAPGSGLLTVSLMLPIEGVVLVVLVVVVVPVLVVPVCVSVPPVFVSVAPVGAPWAVPWQDSINVGVAPFADVSPATLGSSPIAIGTATIDSWPVTLECAYAHRSLPPVI